MKVLLNWLKEFVPFELSANETASLLSRLGFEVADVQHFGGKLQGVVAALVQEVAKHPNADRLSVCKVFDGQTTFSIVCGAPNVRAGLVIPLARVGATLPDGTVLRAAKLRGVESQGMICSAAELGLEDKSDGIMPLDEKTPLGADVRSLLGLDDALIELEVTPNRRDALGVLGVAREIAAGLALPLKIPEPHSRELDLPQSVTVINEAQELCPRYIARTIRDVRVASSPHWMVQRLARCGIRSINNVVDITNYVMLELGQPMHAFDASKLSGRQLRVRQAVAGETLVTLDGKEIALKKDMLVIADDKKPLALAGIIGGQYSAISTETTEIVLESAAFAPAPIRETRKAVGALTESAYRFERGTDWDMVFTASRRAAQLVQELTGGLVCKPVEKSAPAPAQITVKLRTERIPQLLGVEIKDSVATDMLRRLGCVINMGTGQLAATIPRWRLDLSTDADILEELARLYGYDHIPSRTPTIRPTAVPDDTLRPFERRLATWLTGLGFSEAFNYSFLSEKQAAMVGSGFGHGNDSHIVRIANPMSLDQAALRASLLPSLLQNVALNFRRGASTVQLFEIARVYHEDSQGRHELRRVGVIWAGASHAAHWREKTRAADFFDLTGALESLLDALGIAKYELLRQPAAAFHPNRSCLLMSGIRTLGWVGSIHPDIQQRLDIPSEVAAAELDISNLQAAVPTATHYAPPSPFPPVRRDLSFIIAEATSYDRVMRAMRTAAGPMLETIAPIDVFSSEKIGRGKKSMTVSLTFRQKDRTLNDAEVDTVTKKIIKDLEQKCDATLRQ